MTRAAPRLPQDFVVATCRDAAKISQTAFVCFINVVLWERAPYVASLIVEMQPVLRSGLAHVT